MLDNTHIWQGITWVMDCNAWGPSPNSKCLDQEEFRGSNRQVQL